MKNRKYVVKFIKEFISGPLAGMKVPVETSFVTLSAAKTYYGIMLNANRFDAIGEDSITGTEWKVADIPEIVYPVSYGENSI